MKDWLDKFLKDIKSKGVLKSSNSSNNDFKVTVNDNSSWNYNPQYEDNPWRVTITTDGTYGHNGYNYSYQHTSYNDFASKYKNELLIEVTESNDGNCVIDINSDIYVCKNEEDIFKSKIALLIGRYVLKNDLDNDDIHYLGMMKNKNNIISSVDIYYEKDGENLRYHMFRDKSDNLDELNLHGEQKIELIDFLVYQIMKDWKTYNSKKVDNE